MSSPMELPAIARAMLAASGDGAAVFSADLRVTWANERSYELLRARPGSLLGRHLFSFVSTADLTAPKADWRAFYERTVRDVPMQARNDLVLTRNDTTQASFVVGASRLDDDSVLLLFNEFEGRAEIEQMAAALSHRYQDLFQSIPIAVWEIDMRRLVPWLDALPCAPEDTAEYLDTHPEEVIANLHLLDVRAVNRVGLQQLEAGSASSGDIDAAMAGGAQPETLGGFSAQFQAVRTRTQSIVTEGVGGTGSGGGFDAEIHQFIPDGADGPDLSGVIVTLIDVSAAKLTESALGSAIEARDRLISSVAHELRTPLTVVIGLLHMLADSPTNLAEADVQELLATATSEAEDLNHLIDDLLTYSRLDTSDWHIAPTTLDLRALVEEVEVRTEHGTKPPITIEGGARCTADPRRVRQIVRNLLTNTIRYGGPTIHLRMHSDEMAHLEVRDDGQDIPADAELIFEAFHQTHARTTQPSSLGLGLTISRGLAQAMGGDLVHRREEGWTVFDLTLPLA